MKNLLLQIGTGVCLFHCSVGTALADYVVLHSDAADVVQGQLIVEQTPLILKDGERIVLLSESGDLIEIVGPSEGLPQGTTIDNFNVRDALTSLIDAPSQLHNSLGSTRLADIQRRYDSSLPVWQLDPFSSGTQCTIENEDVSFWRAESVNQLSLILQRPGVDGGGDVRWSAGQQTTSWPVAVPLVNGELYVLRRPGWMESAMIRIAVLPEAVSRKQETVIAWLAISDCKRQARSLMDEIR